MAESHQDEIAKLEALYESNPRGRVFTHLAEAYRKAGKLERAREIVQDGLRIHEDYASAHVVLGRIFVDLGRDDDAAPEFERVLALDPENRIALRGLGDYARSRGNPVEALAYYRQLERFDPGDESLTATIGELEQVVAAHDAPAMPGTASPPPTQDVFGGFAEPYGGSAAPGGGMAAGGDPEPSGYGFAEPDAASAPGQPGEPPSFEPLPLSLDWPTAGATGTNSLDAMNWGVEELPDAESAEPPPAPPAPPETGHAASGNVPGLSLDWDLHGGGDAHAPPMPGQAADAGGEAGDALGSGFRLDTPSDASSPEWGAGEDTDPARAWRELEEAASAALPPADYDALPPAAEAEDDAQRARGDAAAAFASWGEYGAEHGEPAAEAAGEPAREPDDEAYPEDDESALPDAADTEVYTETLADLYRAQGFPERAAEVYRALLADRPGDERLLTKLREVEGSDVIDPSPGVAADAASWTALADSMERRAGGDVSDEADSSAPDEAAVAAESGRPAEWVESVESVWTGGDGATAIGDSIFAPPPDESPADATAGQPISEVLGALLDWKPTRQADGDPEEELLLLDEIVEEGNAPVGEAWDEADGFVHGDAAPAGPGGEDSGHAAAPWTPPWDTGDAPEPASPWDAGDAEEPASPWDAGAAPEPAASWDAGDAAEPASPWDAGEADEPASSWDAGYAGEPASSSDADDAPPSASPWGAAEEVPPPAPWDSDDAAVTDDAEPRAAEPAEPADTTGDPWDTAPPLPAAGQAPAADEPMPWEDVPSPPPRAEVSDADLAMPWDDDVAGQDPLAAAAGPGGVGNPFEAADLPPGGGQRPAGGGAAAESGDDDEDDDDLEMFRSWLQSLKR